VVLIAEVVQLLLDYNQSKSTNGFYCHLFGCIAGALVGLKVFEKGPGATSPTKSHLILGNIGLILFLIMIIILILLNIFTYFLD